MEVVPNVKVKQGTEKRHESLPERFASLRDAAEFWDKHDSAEYEYLMVDVDFDVEIKKRRVEEKAS